MHSNLNTSHQNKNLHNETNFLSCFNGGDDEELRYKPTAVEKAEIGI